MADAHGDGGGGGSPYSFLYILVGAMAAALVFQAVRTTPSTSLSATTSPSQNSSETAVTTQPIRAQHIPPKQKKVTPRKEHWTTITLDQNNEIMSIVHYER